MAYVPLPPTKRVLRERMRVNDSQLSKIFGLTRAAVAHWPHDEPIPDDRWFQLITRIRPEVLRLFPKEGKS